MIASFKDKASEEIFYGVASKQAQKACPQSLWRVATRKLDQLDSVTALDELRIPPGDRLEALSGNLASQFSIRINQQYRICFKWEENSPLEVEVTDYH
jgi:toxin HigB-1